MKKLIVRIAEGLGNQMFMYSHSYSLSIVQSLLSSNFAVIPQFLVKGRFFNQIQVDV